MIVFSSDFKDHQMIPKQHTGFGDDLSPEFIVKDIPKGTVSIAIIMDDLDVPFIRAFTLHCKRWINEGKKSNIG